MSTLLLVAQLLHPLDRADGKVVLQEGDGCGIRRRAGEDAVLLAEPLAQQAVATLEQHARTGQDLRPYRRRQGRGGQVVRQHRGGDGRVLVPAPHVGDRLRRSHRPAHAQARQPVGLAHRALRQHLVIATVEGGRLVALTLGAAVDLVGQQPGPRALRRSDHGGHLRLAHDAAGGVVGVDHADHPGVRADRLVEGVGVERPVTVDVEVDLLDAAAAVAGHAPHLHVVGQHDDDLVSRLQERGDGEIVRLRRTDGDEHVVRRGTRIQRGDRFAQLDGAVGLWVEHAHAGEVVGLATVHRQQLAQGHGVDTALGEVDVHHVLPLGHHLFHHERLEGGHGKAPRARRSVGRSV